MRLHGTDKRFAVTISLIYIVFELIAFVALATAVVLSVYEFFRDLIEHGFEYNAALEKVLLILVFIDLMRTITGSLTEGRFRMDVLLEAITIAIARDLIGALALIREEFNPLKLVVLTGMLAVTALLWWMARRVERREPGPRLALPCGREAGEQEG
jgi:uncharacterized membrane protein (DUF373 family)